MKRQKEKRTWIKRNVVGKVGVFYPPDTSEVYCISNWFQEGPADRVIEEKIYAEGKVAEVRNVKCDPGVVELQIALEHSDWCKFQEQEFYHQLIQYLDNLKKKMRGKHHDKEKDLSEV